MHTTTRRYLTLLFCLALLVPLASLMVGALEPAQAATATIHGTVRLNDGGDGGPGTRLANIKVIFWRRDGRLTIEKWTGPDGYFSSGRVDDAGVGFNVAFNKPDRQNPVPGEPGLNPEYTYEETFDVYLSDAVNGYKVVNRNLNRVSGTPPSPNPTPGPAPGPTSDLFGLAINANRDTQNPPDSELADLGVRWVRTIKYSQDVPTHGNVNWLVIFNQESIPQNSGESWENYANRFAQEVKNRVQANPAIRGVQVWNEPDSKEQGVGPYVAEKDYAVLLRAVYLKVKELPNPPVVVFAGLCTGKDGAANYVRNVRSHWGGQIYFDAVGFHPYMATCGGEGWSDRGSIDTNINTLYAQTGGRQIWLTEFGGPVQAFGNDENRQAAYLDCLYRRIPTLKDGSKPKVGVAFWFAWDDRTHYDPVKQHFGLVRQNWQQNYPGNPSAYRRPAWYKYQALAKGSSPAPNPVVFSDGMEGGTGAWTAYQVTVAGSTAQKHAGSASMQASGKGPVYRVKDGKSVSGGTYVTNYLAVSPNTKYEVSAWIYNPDSANVEANLYVQQYRGTTYTTKIKGSNAFSYDQYMVKTVNRNNGWQKLTVTFTTHGEARYLDPSLCTRETGKQVFWDDVQIRKV